MGTRIKAVVKENDVYVRCTDIITSLYEDLDNVKSDAVKEYIRDEIKMWKDYQENIYEQHNKKF